MQLQTADRMPAVHVQYMHVHLGVDLKRKKDEIVIGWIIRAAVELNKGGEMREVKVPPGEPSLGRQSENDEPYAPAYPLCYHGDRGEREWCVC